MSPKGLAALTLGVAAMATLAGCSSSVTPTPTSSGSSPTPTYSCTPASGGQPAPCTPEEFTAQEQANELVRQAKEDYNQLYRELSALQRAGGATEASAELSRRAGGPYLEGQVANLTQLRSMQARLTGDARITKLEAAQGAAAKGYETALLACVDARQTKLVTDTTTVATGRLIAEIVYFKVDGEVLKAWDSEKVSAKKSC